MTPLSPPEVTLLDYLSEVCSYQSRLVEINRLPDATRRSVKKAEQLRLATLCAEVVARDLRRRGIAGAKAGEVPIAGALSRPRVDVSDASLEDGLRLGVEIKTVNEAAGRAMWNRVGDLRSFAVNFHLKFPYAVLGGVISVPEMMAGEPNLERLLRRAERILGRVNGRPDEGSAPHRLEGVALIVYRCAEAPCLHPDMPNAASGLRYEEFVATLAATYDSRFFARPTHVGSGADL